MRSDAGAPGGDVRTLSLEGSAENYKAVLELLSRALVENARGYDAKDLRAAGTPNEMNLRSVFSDADLDAETALFLLGAVHAWAATHLDARLRAWEFYLGAL